MLECDKHARTVSLAVSARGVVVCWAIDSSALLSQGLPQPRPSHELVLQPPFFALSFSRALSLALSRDALSSPARPLPRPLPLSQSLAPS
jgi:hypothetical protein